MTASGFPGRRDDEYLEGIIAATRAERREGGSPGARTAGTANLSMAYCCVLRSVEPIFMRRFAAIVAFAGAVIVSTRILAPAEPPLARPPVVAAELAFIGQAAPILDQVD